MKYFVSDNKKVGKADYLAYETGAWICVEQ